MLASMCESTKKLWFMQWLKKEKFMLWDEITFSFLVCFFWKFMFDQLFFAINLWCSISFYDEQKKGIESYTNSIEWEIFHTKTFDLILRNMWQILFQANRFIINPSLMLPHKIHSLRRLTFLPRNSSRNY